MVACSFGHLYSASSSGLLRGASVCEDVVIYDFNQLLVRLETWFLTDFEDSHFIPLFSRVFSATRRH